MARMSCGVTCWIQGEDLVDRVGRAPEQDVRRECRGNRGRAVHPERKAVAHARPRGVKLRLVDGLLRESRDRRQYLFAHVVRILTVLDACIGREELGIRVVAEINAELVDFLLFEHEPAIQVGVPAKRDLRQQIERGLVLRLIGICRTLERDGQPRQRRRRPVNVGGSTRGLSWLRGDTGRVAAVRPAAEILLRQLQRAFSGDVANEQDGRYSGR